MYARLSSDTSTSGGSSDTDTNAFAVMPCVCPACSVVIIVTPLAKRPSAFRNRRESKGAELPIGFLLLLGGGSCYDLRPFFITTLMSSGLIRSGTVQPFKSYSAMHCSAKPLYLADCPIISATIKVSNRMLS